MRRVISLFLSIVLLVSTSNSRIVEVSPSFNMMKGYKGNIILENMENEIGNNLLRATFLIVSTEKDMKDLETSIQKYKNRLSYINYSNYVDPIYDISKLIVYLSGIGVKDEKNTVDKLKSVLSAIIGTKLEQIANAIELAKSKNLTMNMIAWKILIQPYINNMIKEILNKSDTILGVKMEKSPIATYLLSKAGDIITTTLSTVIDKSWNTSVKGELINIVKGGFLKGVMSYIAVVPALVEGLANSAKLVNSILNINDSQNTIKNILFKSLLLSFIRDYVQKYNMNIYKMAEDSIINKNYIPFGLFKESAKPDDFFEVFLYYLLSHNEKGKVSSYDDSYIGKSKVDIESPWYSNLVYNILTLGKDSDVKIKIYNIEDEKTLLLLAREALDLIEMSGDGGNLKVLLDVDDKNKKLYINGKSFCINRYYWMPSRKYIENYFINDSVTWFYYFSDKYEYSLTPPTPFDNTVKTIISTYIANNTFKTEVCSRKHINIDVTLNKVDNKWFYIKNIKKTINYNGFIVDAYHNNDALFYSKANYQINRNLLIPNYNYINNIFTKTKVANLIIRLIKNNIIPKNILYDGTLKKYLLEKPLLATDVVKFFKLYDNKNYLFRLPHNHFTIKYFNNKSKFITRKELFNALVKYYNLKINYNQKLKNDWTYEGATLAQYHLIKKSSKMFANVNINLYTLIQILLNEQNIIYNSKFIKLFKGFVKWKK